jgi:alpha,alpha-trehalase
LRIKLPRFDVSVVSYYFAPMTITQYIAANIERSIYRDADGSGFRGIDLPWRYTSPSIKGEGKFSFFFYWDTHFTQYALYHTGRADVARDNIRNILWLIERHGYMPNHVGLDNRSQAPYLCRMVKDYFAHIGGVAVDPGFFRQCAEGVRREYHFWRTARITPTGLCHYGHHDTAAGCRQFYDGMLVRRLQLPVDVPDADKERVGGHYLAHAEATCDFSPRFTDGRCLDFCQPELNALLFEYEETLAGWAPLLEWDAAFFADAALQRKARVNDLLWSEELGLFLDYDFVNGCHSAVPALTGFQTLDTGLATPAQASRMVAQLGLFERQHGIAYTPDVAGCRSFQWAFPNVWPPMVSILMTGLQRYGFLADAQRLARKYVATADRLFAKTGRLWEKTDAETGEVAGGEYEAAAMIGWSAGVYLQAAALLNQHYCPES